MICPVHDNDNRAAATPGERDGRYRVPAGWETRTHAAGPGWESLYLVSQEMGEAQLKIITQTFCGAEETSPDSIKLLVSCRERRVSGVPKNGQERKGRVSPGIPCLMETPGRGLLERSE